MRAQQAVRGAVGHQFDKAARVARGQRSRHMFQGEKGHRHLVSLFLCLSLGQPHCGHLGVGKYHLGQDAQVQALVITLQRVLRRDSSAGRGHVHQFGPRGHIAGRVNARVARLHVGIHHNESLVVQFDAGLLQPHVLGVRRPARGHEDLFRAKLATFAAHFSHYDFHSSFLANGNGLHTRVNGYPLLAQVVGQRAANLRLMVGENARTALQNGHLRAQARKSLAQFQGHRAAANDDQGARLLLQGHSRGTRENLHLVNPLQGEDTRPRARGDHYPPGPIDLIVHHHGAIGLKSRPPPHKGDVIAVRGQHAYVLALPQLPHQTVLLPDHITPANAFGPGEDAGKGMVAGLVVGLRGAHEGLGGHTANVHAGAPDSARFDDGHLVSQFRAAYGRGHARAPGANDQQVIITGLLSVYRPDLDGLVFAHASLIPRLSHGPGEGVGGDGWIGNDLRATRAPARHSHIHNAGDALQRAGDVHRTRITGHALNVQYNVYLRHEDLSFPYRCVSARREKERHSSPSRRRRCREGDECQLFFFCGRCTPKADTVSFQAPSVYDRLYLVLCNWPRPYPPGGDVDEYNPCAEFCPNRLLG